MQRLLLILKALALTTVPVCGVFLCLLLIHTDKAVKTVDVSGTIVQLNKALTSINHPCKPGPCGTLAGLDQSMHEVDSLIFATNKTVFDADRVEQTEMTMLPQWNAQVTTTLTNMNETVTATGSSLTEMTRGALPVLSSTNAAVQHIDALVTSPYVLDTMKNVDASTATLADTAKHIDGTTASVEAATTDIQVKVHHITNPEKVKLGFWGGTWAVMKEITSHSPPLF